jgi:hypothetical protein
MLPVEFHILLSLVAGERHGYGIAQDMLRRGERSAPDDGTMYRALARLVKRGLIEVAPAALERAEGAAEVLLDQAPWTATGAAPPRTSRP